MSETGKRNPDRMNMIGVVVVGICGAVLVYVSIALLQAYYMNDTSQVENRAEYGGQDKDFKALRSEQLLHIDPPQGVRNGDTFEIRIDRAIELVAEEAKAHPQSLVPSQGDSDATTVKPAYGRPQPLAGSGSGAGSGGGAGSGAAPTGGAGSGSAATGAVTPPTPTMTATGVGGGGGAAGASPSAAAAGGSGSANPAAAGSGSGGHGP